MYDDWKRYVFRCLLTVSREVTECTLSGRLFYACTAATPNARLPTVQSRVHVRGTIRLWMVDDRKPCRELSPAQFRSLARYSGAMLLRQQKMNTARQNLMHSGTLSQCRTYSWCSAVEWYGRTSVFRVSNYCILCIMYCHKQSMKKDIVTFSCSTRFNISFIIIYIFSLISRRKIYETILYNWKSP